MDYCKICKSKLEYLEKTELVSVNCLPVPIFYCPTCGKDVKQDEVLKFEDMILERILKLEEELIGSARRSQ